MRGYVLPVFTCVVLAGGACGKASKRSDAVLVKSVAPPEASEVDWPTIAQHVPPDVKCPPPSGGCEGCRPLRELMKEGFGRGGESRPIEGGPTWAELADKAPERNCVPTGGSCKTCEPLGHIMKRQFVD